MMARDEKDTVKLWLDRANAALTRKEEWEKKFEVGTCRKFYDGDQVDRKTDLSGDRVIVINKVGAAVRTAIPNLVFRHPYVRVLGSPSREDTQGQVLDTRAQLLQDTVNSIIRDPVTQFNEQVFPAMKEAFWAFGCVETGYAADFVDDATAPKPALKEGDKTEVDNPVPQVRSESFYVKHIPAKTVVTSGRETSVLAELDWVAYYEWINLEDVKAAPSYKGKTEGLKATGRDSEKDGEEKDPDTERVKVWKLWDQRTKTKIVFADGHDQMLLEAPFTHLPLHFLRFECQTDSFFPIPPIYAQLGPQREYNDSRDTLRKLRKAIVPRYTFDEQAMSPEDLEKFETGDIGVYISVRNQNPSPINPVNQPSFSEGSITSLTLAGQEFAEMSSTSNASRKMGSSDTATEAKIINTRQAVSESFDRQTVSLFLSSVAKGLLQCAIDYMILDHWVLMNSDPFSPYFEQDAQDIAQQYQLITFQELQKASSTMRWDVSVDVESLSPASEEEKRATWNTTLQMLGNAPIARLLAQSKELLKRTLDLNGMHSAKDQSLISDALMKVAVIEMQMAAAGAKPGPGISGQAPAQAAGVPGPTPGGRV